MTRLTNDALGVAAAFVLSAAALAMSAAVNSVAAQQSTTSTSTPPPTPIKRRALEIRGQTPAPEVVTVRPREVPQYTHRIIAPTLYDDPPASRASTTVVILPAPLDVRPAGQPNPPPKP